MSSKAGIVEELHRGARRNFPRRYVTIKGPNDLYQADLVDMKKYSNENKGYKYLLTMIDTFSKRGWALPLKTKTGPEVAKTLDDVFSKLEKTPKFLQVDSGTEFYNQKVRKILEDHKISLYSSYSNLKASICERYNRTIKTWMFKEFSLRGNYKWVDFLDALLERYNHRVHRIIGIAPVNVNSKNHKKVLKRIINEQKSSILKVRKRRKKKFKKGEYVRISKFKHVFEKGYTPNWTTELYIVDVVQKTIPVTYKLKDVFGEDVDGAFYEQELQKTKYKNTYLVEKVLRRKDKRVLVKWLGFGKEHNQWIDAEDLE